MVAATAWNLESRSFRNCSGLKFYRGQDLFQPGKHCLTIYRRNFFHLAVIVSSDSQRKFVASAVVEGVIVLCVRLFRHGSSVVFDLMKLSGAKLHLLDLYRSRNVCSCARLGNRELGAGVRGHARIHADAEDARLEVGTGIRVAGHLHRCQRDSTGMDKIHWQRLGCHKGNLCFTAGLGGQPRLSGCQLVSSREVK